MKFHELAKELGCSSKELLEQARTKDIKIKSHLVVLDEETQAKLRKLFSKKARPASGGAKPSPVSSEKEAKPVKETPLAPVPTPEKEAVPSKEKEFIAIIDKPAHTEKEIRAMRPMELEEKEVQTEVKEKRRIKIFSRPLPYNALPVRIASIPSSGTGIASSIKTLIAKKPVSGRKIEVEAPVTLKDISEKIGIRANQIIQRLMGHNLMFTINSPLDEDALILIGLEFNYDIELKKPKDILSELIKAEKDNPADLVHRPPVVVVMGHVDHGKTSLLDRIRGTNIAANEAGAITQHLGAYQVTVNNRKITFLDTPGHEAFTNMRARGANITDIAILVVAADDGVMPQTEEAINHIKAANANVIVAINKVDKQDANLMKVKQQLASLELTPEEWSGHTIFAEVSALTGQGVDHLLEMILLQAEVLELKANPKRKADGTVLEAKFTEDMGPRATVLVQNGTLRKGDVVVCGATYGKIRAMYDYKFNQITEALPATPVAIAGFIELPETGDKLYVLDDIKKAKEIAETVKNLKKAFKAAPVRHLTMETLFNRIAQDKIAEVRVIIKVDVKGSLEVLQNLLGTLAVEEIKIRIIHSGVGSITESDVILADASDAIIIGFNVTPDNQSKAMADEKGVQIKTYKVIYQIIEDLKLALAGLLKPEKVEVVTAHLVVRQLFNITRKGAVAGCQVIDGKIKRSDRVRIKREKETTFDGKIASLKRFKEDVSEVAEGFECGIKVEGHDDIKPGDIIESYRIEERTRRLI